MPMELPMNLSPFCGNDPVREYLQQPFTIGDWTYATNGHIAVRVPKLPDVPENPKAPDAKKLFDMVPRTGEFRQLPAVKIPKPTGGDECKKCDGRGYLHDCPGCHCTCLDCGGSGYPVEGANTSVGIKPAVFAARYIVMLQKLQGVEISILEPMEPMPFRFNGGGEGLLMPMRGPRSTHIEAE